MSSESLYVLQILRYTVLRKVRERANVLTVRFKFCESLSDQVRRIRSGMTLEQVERSSCQTPSTRVWSPRASIDCPKCWRYLRSDSAVTIVKRFSLHRSRSRPVHFRWMLLRRLMFARAGKLRSDDAITH